MLFQCYVGCLVVTNFAHKHTRIRLKLVVLGLQHTITLVFVCLSCCFQSGKKGDKGAQDISHVKKVRACDHKFITGLTLIITTLY